MNQVARLFAGTMTPTDSYAVPASAFEPAAVETPAERAVRKAVKAAKKAAKAKAAAVSPATTPELVPGAAKKKRKAAEPAAVEPAAKELKPTRLSNAAYRTTHEIKARSPFFFLASRRAQRLLHGRRYARGLRGVVATRSSLVRAA